MCNLLSEKNEDILLVSEEKVYEYIDTYMTPVEEYKRKYGEVLTPPNFIKNEMLSKLENHYFEKNSQSIYSNHNLKWFDFSCGIGNFQVVIFFNLMNGLKSKFTNYEQRKKFIIEEMLFMCEINPKNTKIFREIFEAEKYKLNLYEGDALQIDICKEFNVKCFDVIIGNPPYNKEFNGGGASPIYNDFVTRYIDKCKYMTLVIPSRWFKGGKGLCSFRKFMLQRNDIVYIIHYDDSKQIFDKNVNIEGGVNYFLKDTDYEGDCKLNGKSVKLGDFDIVLDNKHLAFIKSLDGHPKLTKLYKSSSHFKIQTNDNRLFETCENNDAYRCYVSQQKGFSKYISKKEIEIEKLGKYKVITSRANGSKKCFGNIFIGTPFEVYTQSYISFEVENYDQATSLVSFLNSRFANFLLSLRKISQDISESTCSWIPLPPLDRIWNDETIEKYYKVTWVEDYYKVKERKTLRLKVNSLDK